MSLRVIISQDVVGAPRSIAVMSEFISCCSALAAPEDPPFCNIPYENWRNVSYVGSADSVSAVQKDERRQEFLTNELQIA